VLNYDNEPGYDFLYLLYEHDIGLQIAWTGNGQDSTVTLHETIVFEPDDYVPHPDTGITSCHLRWNSRSDGAWSDADCDWPSTGLAQIDNIEVSGDNGVLTILEDCEGSAHFWHVAFPSGVGDFSKVWPLLEDLDPASQNDTPQFAFIDDGVVVPESEGQHCLTWCYGPDGWCVTATGGALGGGCKILNEIWSPVISWSDKNYDVAILKYKAYRHNDRWLPPSAVDTWRVRSTNDPSGVIGWTDWTGDEGPRTAEPLYVQLDNDIADLLVADCKYIQIALGVHDISVYWSWEYDPTPAPYLDNVSVYVVSGLSNLPGQGTSPWLSYPTPNPFNPSSEVEFYIPRDGRVTAALYDMRGQLIRQLFNGFKQAGPHTVEWDGNNESGAAAATGTYIFRISAERKTLTTKGILLK